MGLRKRISRHGMFIEMASSAAKRSTCERLQVGCLIAFKNRPITMGYNGPLPEESHCQGNCNVELPCTRAVHAEANAIYFAAREGIILKEATIYCTHQPCLKCAEAIIQSGIETVVYVEPYRDISGLNKLLQHNIAVMKYTQEDDSVHTVTI
jgi:dCMP deaminase